MDKINSYLSYSLERCAKTIAQTALATIGTAALGVLGLRHPT